MKSEYVGPKNVERGWKLYTCEFPGCNKTISRRKSTIIDGRRICRSHEKSVVINVNMVAADTNTRYRLLCKVAG
jgi:hypothetical protein